MYGAINLKAESVLPLKYSSIYSFMHGIAPIELNEKWGFVDPNGKTTIPHIYDRFGTSRYEFYKVMMIDNWGIMKPSGDLLIPLEYESIDILSEQLFVAEFKWQKGRH